MVSGSVALLCSRFFSPFPHGTGSLSVSREYLALRDGPRQFARNSSCSGLLRCRLESLNAFAYGAVTRCGPTFQSVRLAFSSSWRRSYNPARRIATPAVWALPRSLATTCGIIVIFSSYGYLDVSVPHVRLPYGMTGLQPAGLPHSDIPGSRAICASPELFAAYHVLRRLREPRHPPSALAYFLSPRTYVRVDIS